MVLPELFWRDPTGSLYARALEINAGQIKHYLDKYRAGPSGGELEAAWSQLEASWSAIGIAGNTSARSMALRQFSRLALFACRDIWTQFDVLSMSFGLATLCIGVIATWILYSRFSEAKADRDVWIDANLIDVIRGLAVGAILGVAFAVVLHRHQDALHFILFCSPLISSFALIIPSAIKFFPRRSHLATIPVILILHSIAFGSNSFTFWEDRMVNFLLTSSAVPSVLTGISAPTSRLRNRILGFALLFAVCVRLMAISTVCREEQQPLSTPYTVLRRQLVLPQPSRSTA